MEPRDGMRVGRLAELVGVSTDVLRVWERRYGLFSPSRSAGGYRLYDESDLELARRVVALRERGVPVSAAIATVTKGSGGGPDATRRRPALQRELDRAVRQFDEAGFDAVFDLALAELGPADTVHELLIPYLGDVGTQWAAGRMSVAQEHFLSQLVRRRVSGLAVRGEPDGPLAVLACPPKEHHDLALLCLGALISPAGWRVRFLGADTPMADLARACEQIRPDVVILSATRRAVFDTQVAGMRRVAAGRALWLGGRGASTAVAVTAGARLLPEHLRDAVELLCRSDDWRG